MYIGPSPFDLVHRHLDRDEINWHREKKHSWICEQMDQGAIKCPLELGRRGKGHEEGVRRCFVDDRICLEARSLLANATKYRLSKEQFFNPLFLLLFY